MKKSIVQGAIVLLFLCLTALNSNLNAQTLQEKPNILLIFIDDMGWPAISCLGNEHVQTKNIDKIAENGMLFTDAYVTPQCTPTRASLLTGQHTARNRFWHVIGRYGYPYMRMDEPPYEENLSRDAYTLAEMMQDNGYTTSINGKWHLHTWNDRYPNPDGYYTYLFDHANEYYGWDYNSIPENMSYHQEGEKGVDYLTDEAIKVIDQSSQKPFFIYLSQHTIHGPVLAPEKLIKKYLKKGYPEEGVFNATYLAAIEHMDNSVGRLLDHIDKKGIAENTIVIFLTDNGGVDMEFANDPLRYGKGSMYEGGIRNGS
jgi:arylsulfatase A